MSTAEAASKRVAVVSGAASGIGAATVRELSDSGFAVIGIDLAAAPRPLASIPDLSWLRGDVTDPAIWVQAGELSRRIDPHGAWALVPCAADVSVSPLLDTPPDEWRRLYEINVIGAVNGMQALLPPMVERQAGAVVVCCSVSSMFAEREIGAYSASKAALLSATRTLALEHAGDGIRINAVCPGVVDTPLLRKHIASMPDPEAAERAIRQRIPTGAITRSEEIAGLIRYLVSDGATGLSGSAVIIDGGLTTTYAY